MEALRCLHFCFCCSEVTVFESFVTLEQAGSRQGRRGRRGMLRAGQAGLVGSFGASKIVMHKLDRSRSKGHHAFPDVL